MDYGLIWRRINWKRIVCYWPRVGYKNGCVNSRVAVRSLASRAPRISRLSAAGSSSGFTTSPQGSSPGSRQIAVEFWGHSYRVLSLDYCNDAFSIQGNVSHVCGTEISCPLELRVHNGYSCHARKNTSMDRSHDDLALEIAQQILAARMEANTANSELQIGLSRHFDRRPPP
jgi:hypothetical protein